MNFLQKLRLKRAIHEMEEARKKYNKTKKYFRKIKNEK